MAKKGNNFTEEFFHSKGFIKDANGNWSPPPPAPKEIKADVIVEKKEVVKTPDFQSKPVTEWFIKGYSVPSKKNSRQNFVSKTTHKMISLPSKSHAEYVKVTKMQYEVFGNEFKRTVERLGVKPPFRIEFTFIRATRHSFDYCNACQTCEDIMKGHWIEDDSADFIIPSFQPYQYNKEMPGVIIKLLV